MQATDIRGAKGVQWFGNHRMGGALIIIALIVAGLLAAAAATRTFGDTDTPGNTRPVIAPKAYHVPQAGEGLLGEASVAGPQLKAFYVPEAGEGRIGGFGVERLTRNVTPYPREKQREGIGSEPQAKLTNTDDYQSYLDTYYPGFEKLVVSTPLTFERIRFLEMNGLPGDFDLTRKPAGVLPLVVPYERMRFLEMNQLPEATIPHLPQVLDRWDMLGIERPKSLHVRPDYRRYDHPGVGPTER
jgi:hypothetical protein